jgi:hypothetical protein
VTRRIAPALLLVATMTAACGGDPAASPSTSPTTSPSTAATAPAPSGSDPSSETAAPSGGPTTSVDDDVAVPDDAPTSLAEDVTAAQLADDPPMPRGATLASSWASEGAASTEAVAFAWRRGKQPLAVQNGLEVWIRFPGEEEPWRAVYAFTDPPSSGVLGVSFDEGDLTGDGEADLLSFEDIGGSGACGTWRVVLIADRDATETWARQTCDTRVRIVGGDLEVREAVFEAGDSHCCPSAFRTTRLRWDGGAWTVVERTTEPA